MSRLPSPAFAGIAVATFAASFVAASPPPTIELSGIARDFKRAHPDFDISPSGGMGHSAANVDQALGTGMLPVYDGGGFKVGLEWTDQDGAAIAPHLFGQDGSEPEPPTAEDCGAINVLLVVASDSPLTSQDAAKKAAMEAWGHVVSVIDDEATQAEIDAAVAVNDLVYISEEVDHGNVGDKYMLVPIGVVNEDKDLSDHELGFSTSKKTWTGTTITIIDNTHPITEGLPLGDIVITDDNWNMHRADGSFAPGGRSLAEKPGQAGKPALMVVERGDLLEGDIPAPARRVRLPWGNHSVDFNTINALGLTVMRRAVCWCASDNPPACGDVADTAGSNIASSTGDITSAASFATWYVDLFGTSVAAEHSITLQFDGAGVFEYLDDDFHPIDGRLFGNEGDLHNNFFTYAIEAGFVYEACAGQFIEARGADDIWVFVDGRLGIDLGGLGADTDQLLVMDRLGLADGQPYEVHVFYAHRSASAAKFHLRTNIELFTDPVEVAVNWPCD